MKAVFVIVLSLAVSGCSLFGQGSKRAPEIVPSCFSDGEDQSTYCKSQRINSDGRIVVTRCIGTLNQEAKPTLRGKCVEKICSEGSNTDCQVRGEFAVLEQYAELATANLFASDESVPSNKNMSVKGKGKGKNKNKAGANANPSAAAAAAVATPTPAPALTSESSPTPNPAEKAALKQGRPTEKPSLQLVLKPAKKSRSQANTKGGEKKFKKVCISKKEMSAPANLRGKCATRNCTKGKCSYKGRKEMFDWVARNQGEGK